MIRRTITTNLTGLLTFIMLVFGLERANAQTGTGSNMNRQILAFSLFDKTGKQLTDEDLKTGLVKVYSLRESSKAFYPQLAFDKETGLFTFSEPVLSYGIALAFVTPAETMYVFTHGRFGPPRTIDGIKIQKGSYIFSSNDFAKSNVIKVDDWSQYLEDETPVAKQDLSAYNDQLQGKRPVPLLKKE
ncbi:hypothetical protein [Adhaeribacter aquaticus]|uniref:hypothetical protein n=1 Tax=Adhaeribacter aquaticus TaxID=299567 RepID=UPI00047C899D|nr:hypothetical protein [Adhaeribacter aquaticus]